jgi:hypothetical protein
VFGVLLRNLGKSALPNVHPPVLRGMTGGVRAHARTSFALDQAERSQPSRLRRAGKAP